MNFELLLLILKGYADIVKKRNLSKEEQEKYLTIIVDETNRLAKFNQRTI